MKRFNAYEEQRFRERVNKALQQVQSVLDTTRNPRLIDANIDHSYDDKFLMAETVTNESLATLRTCLSRLGVSEAQWERFLEWTAQNKTVTLRFDASDSCSLVKEHVVEVPSGAETTKTTTTTTAASTTARTTTTKIKRKVKEAHWIVNVKHSLTAFAGTDTANSETITHRDASAVIVIGGGRYQDNDAPSVAPIPAHIDHPALDLNITWFLQQLKHDHESSIECDFSIDRSVESAKTPRRNENIEQALRFHKQAKHWVACIQACFVNRVEGTILGKHSPVLPEASDAISTGSICVLQNLTNTDHNGKQVVVQEFVRQQNRYRVEPLRTADGLPSSLLVRGSELLRDPSQATTSLRGLSSDSVFCPIQPFLEGGAVLGDTGALLAAHDTQLDELLEKQAKCFPPAHLSKLLSISEATYVLICRHMETLATHYFDCVDHLEKVMFNQLVKAIGKEVTSSDFSGFMRYHGRQFFNGAYAPRSFSYAVRQPGHAPDGVVAIESNSSEPIDSVVRRVPVDQCPEPLEIPLSAASAVQVTGDRYLHGWMMHQFAGDGGPKGFSLSARARQFSSFMLVIGTMSGANQLEPKHAIILQNKDDLLIPLLTEVLPSAKDFKNATASLSTEQREFAKAFRAMQLGSSVFGVAIIRLKPQFEKLLGLLPGSLTKEIQLTQDLMRLFIDYQIPSDLLSFDGPVDTPKAVRLAAVKEHVAAVLGVITDEKEKTITEEEQRADFRAAVCFGGYGGGGGASFEPDIPKHERNECVYGGGADLFGAECHEEDWDDGIDEDSVIEDGAEDELLDFSAPPKNPIDDNRRQREEETDFRDTHGTPVEDFTLLPKKLDAVMETVDKDNALCSTKLTAGTSWQLQRQENILSSVKKKQMYESDIDAEKKTAFDLLDAITRSGALPLDSAEVHVIVCLSHCFEKDLMGTVIEDNINPIAKAEKSALLLAAAVHRVSPSGLIASPQDRSRLETNFPLLFEKDQLLIS